ncbi:unnamed protein product [Blepharisma stoltei]|uniref:Tetratricopeptide repeat protein n=1 Tax=Blepharisma stoltei TaxID=1481888 RepID=A0AAU9JGS6_9CILI|nr:unnamed protein product [Blepharisma stoltei]
MPLYFIQWAELYIAWNKKEEAEECLSKAENLLNIGKIWLFSKKSIKINDLDCISDYIDLAKIYVSVNNFRKAEKILKYTKDAIYKKRHNDLFSKLDIYYSLGDLYAKKQRYKNAKHYFSKALHLQKKINPNSNAVSDLNKWLIEIDGILEIYG